MGDSGRGRIIVVEDDSETREVIERALAEDGFEVVARARAGEARRAVREAPLTAIILDVSLPDGSGIELCREWRRAGVRVPILMLTARTDVSSRVEGLDAGADDYLGKPFALAELRARVRALMRRGDRLAIRRTLRRGDAVVDFQKRQAWVAGNEVPLTRRELDVLERLAIGAGGAVARRDLLEEIWGEASPETAASLEVIIVRLRRKLENEGKNAVIRTVRGFGYALTAAGREEAE